MRNFKSFSVSTWFQFLNQSINTAKNYCKSNHLLLKPQLFSELHKFASSLKINDPKLIWSDFSTDNIIVKSDGSLSGFIDFEGLLSGDPILGIGYFKAHQSETEIYKMVSQAFGLNLHNRLVDFYSIIRWCRLLPYQAQSLPNGEKRMPLATFLPYSYSLINAL